jgi:hypothetical protein
MSRKIFLTNAGSGDIIFSKLRSNGAEYFSAVFVLLEVREYGCF